jgi:hypothetical protein
MRKTIRALDGKRITFRATHLVEFFPAPLPEEIDGDTVFTESDLLRASNASGYDEFFLVNTQTIDGECDRKIYQFPVSEFIRWQLERINGKTLWQLISKTTALVTELLDSDAEYERDPNYDPESWLNVYAEDEYPGAAVAYIRRLREEVPDKFYEILAKSIVDDRYGLLNTEWYETEIEGNLDEVRALYSHWNVPLMIVSTGKFLPYISGEVEDALIMDDLKVHRMYVRNYDEGYPGQS